LLKDSGTIHLSYIKGKYGLYKMLSEMLQEIVLSIQEESLHSMASFGSDYL
jgi:hypothetical protein